MSLGENYFSTIVKRSIILVAIISGIILITFKDPKPYLYGIIFGSIINLLNFRLMYISTKKAMSLSFGGAQSHVTRNYFIRFTIYGIVILVASKADYINLITVILGFFIVKIVILADTFLDEIRGKRK
ncbi:F-ATPase, F0 complex, subunit I AtpI [Gottschalkia acidurici 9a]|uniref:F-ATPase, F0 complex, subunit I AtpI n=1 Tax=Gottschalkia acidurici (strain ATCC 7906 / DSM 604 / BCRC 14475 / CIP 104303 / KCTC 5404 / NCIMB 10678 / 9a) TaxID=1128398 RepID=K0ATV3_GOTA9|nr:ATP synthase subunit I [Gottschalkia acidurici]AFS77278.1 F-ATPase, F0 complex, subunit I AtpI [Gottschalkia acidurici 9a]